MTSKEVSIKLVSRQSDGNTKEETELISAGLYEATEKGYRISYEESEATGFEGKRYNARNRRLPQGDYEQNRNG